MKPAKKRRGGRSLPRLALLNLLVLAAVYVISNFVAERTPWSTVIAYLPQAIYLIPAVLIYLGLLWHRRFLAFFLFGVPTAALAWFLLGINVPLAKTVDQPNDVTVMAYNIHHASGGWENIRSLIESIKPDIVCVEEADREDAHGEFVTDDIDGYEVVRDQSLTVYSRRPITDSRVVVLSEGAVPALFVKTCGLNVVCMHLASFGTDLADPQSVPRYPEIFGKIARLHRTEVEKLKELIPDGEPTILCGDGNMPPRGQIYSALRASFVDAFNAVGVGPGYTFPSVFPIERIDFAFLSHAAPVRAEVLDTELSDHRPLLVKVRPQG